MEVEAPSDLIREAQVLLRAEAGVASYDPDDPTLPSLPSPEEVVAEFDPSPAYLRCKNCRGRLLRGVQSMACVYCGEELRKDVPPEPIAFKSTLGFRWLLGSLGLDGSETVGPSIETDKLNRGQSASKDELFLSDLLDCEIKWPTESEKHRTSISNLGTPLSKTSLNLAGVNLDNFFSQSNKDTIFNASGEQLRSNSQIQSKESTEFEVREQNDLFDNIQHSAVAVRSTVDEGGDSDSGWEADFQSASSRTAHEHSKSIDPFVGSATDISAQMDTLFGAGQDVKDRNPKDDLVPPASMTNDWIQDDLWNNCNSGVLSQPGQFHTVNNFKDGVTMDNLNNPSSSDDNWIQDDQWQSSNTKVPEDNASTDFESFDTWNNFTKSTSVQDPSNSYWKQSSDEVILPNEQTANIWFSSTNGSGEQDFGSFSQPDIFSGSFSEQNVSAEVNITWSDFSVSDRAAVMKGEVQGNGEYATEGVGVFSETTEPKGTDNVEMIMSQMHDLSFMLEDKLSIPVKPEGFS